MTRKGIAEAFTSLIHREDGEYWAEIPVMPGRITVTDTLAELKINLVEAIRCWVATQGDLARSCATRREAVMA